MELHMLTNWLKHTKCCISHAFDIQNPQRYLRFNILIIENIVKVSPDQYIYVHMHNGLIWFGYFIFVSSVN